MKSLPYGELASLPRRLDLFRKAAPIPLEALAQGLCPPLLLSRGALVWGHRIIDALSREESGPQAILPVEELDLDPRPELLAVLLRERRTASYEAAEEWAVAKEASRLAEGDEAFLASVSLLLRGDPSLPVLLSRLSALAPARARLVETGLLDLKTAERCRSLPEEALAAFKALAPRLSSSERRIAFGFLDDLALGDRHAAPDLAALIREAGARDKPLAYIRSLRYPELASMEAELAAIAARDLGRSGVRLEAPQNFEGTGFSASFEFASGEALGKRIAALERLKEDCDALFGLLR